MSTVIFGFHAIAELLKRGGVKGNLYLSPDKKKNVELRSLAQDQGLAVVLADEAELDAVSRRADHRGAVLVLEEVPFEYRNNLSFILKGITSEHGLVILLDTVTDPHNFGAILRTADQFQADCVVVTERRSAHETQTVVKTSSGASAYVTLVTVPNLHQAIQMLKDNEFWVYGAEAGGTPAEKTNLKGRVALVMGSEGQGLRQLVCQSCDGFVSIPSQGHVDSFNVSVAAGILMYEVRRQQGNSWTK
jgi:23S rRNA (guanosine2251-2'-O)-methyltransferase